MYAYGVRPEPTAYAYAYVCKPQPCGLAVADSTTPGNTQRKTQLCIEYPVDIIQYATVMEPELMHQDLFPVNDRQ